MLIIPKCLQSHSALNKQISVELRINEVDPVSRDITRGRM